MLGFERLHFMFLRNVGMQCICSSSFVNAKGVAVISNGES